MTIQPKAITLWFRSIVRRAYLSQNFLHRSVPIAFLRPRNGRGANHPQIIFSD
jgi:hypothetical protein